MTAEHDLHKEFRQFADELTERRRTDPGFDGLVGRYQSLDKRIVELESGNQPFDDETLGRLRRERVLLKDKIVQQLEEA
ncbi:YdcH family protein [Phytopseudomonas dryadis]|uniref:GTP-binding protein n=1 Tax=Phytopseudomonas dryadis TaxID=2487520 RepID=A0A4Q9R1H5_9GAMM|nr:MULTISPECIES: DUF465 domain-containing protein [Pseudomonas]TBU91603.1 GTP-binding protein [Pseudomonas dryadis]TBV07658.1 GTP-binding protein [Pseudomonas dryadis]TBV19914.1 GTP-binding protein [Pseudomonas sp. FRB 230]